MLFLIFTTPTINILSWNHNLLTCKRVQIIIMQCNYNNTTFTIHIYIFTRDDVTLFTESNLSLRSPQLALLHSVRETNTAQICGFWNQDFYEINKVEPPHRHLLFLHPEARYCPRWFCQFICSRYRHSENGTARPRHLLAPEICHTAFATSESAGNPLHFFRSSIDDKIIIS